MYNGIGLRTARGSGTSGFVQKNLSDKSDLKRKRKQENPWKYSIQTLDDGVPYIRNKEMRKFTLAAKFDEEKESTFEHGSYDTKKSKKIYSNNDTPKINEEITKKDQDVGSNTVDESILTHDQRKRIESKLILAREDLEEEIDHRTGRKKYTKNEIDTKINDMRRKLLASK